MKSLLGILLFLVCLSQQATAELALLLEWQRRGDPGAYVSSGFHDWRTVSKYRRSPGLHAGYDIAMLPNSPVRAAWSGQVLAVTPWYGREFGVTVRDALGFEATYGHISPTVKVGQFVSQGDTLGLVVVDHVDVKIRDNTGAYIDFRDLKLSHSQSRRGRVLKDHASALEQLKELEQARQRYDALKEGWRQKNEGLRLGIIAPRELEKLEEEMRTLEVLLNLDPPTSKEITFNKESAELEPTDPSRPRTDQLMRSSGSIDFPILP